MTIELPLLNNNLDFKLTLNLPCFTADQLLVNGSPVMLFRKKAAKKKKRKKKNKARKKHRLQGTMWK